VDEEEVAAGLLDHLAHGLTGGGEGRDRATDRDAAVAGDLGADPADAADIGLAVGGREAQARAQVPSNEVTVEQSDAALTVLEDEVAHGAGDRGLPGAGEAGEEQDQTVGPWLAREGRQVHDVPRGVCRDDPLPLGRARARAQGDGDDVAAAQAHDGFEGGADGGHGGGVGRVGRAREDEELHRPLARRGDDVEKVVGADRAVDDHADGAVFELAGVLLGGGVVALEGAWGRPAGPGRVGRQVETAVTVGGGRTGRHLREGHAFGIDDLHPTGGQRLRGDGVRDVERGQPVDVLLSQSTGMQQLKIIELVDRWAELRQARCRGSHNRQFCHWLGGSSNGQLGAGQVTAPRRREPATRR
jgi:hypothetical protein